MRQVSYDYRLPSDGQVGIETPATHQGQGPHQGHHQGQGQDIRTQTESDPHSMSGDDSAKGNGPLPLPGPPPPPLPKLPLQLPLPLPPPALDNQYQMNTNQSIPTTSDYHNNLTNDDFQLQLNQVYNPIHQIPNHDLSINRFYLNNHLPISNPINNLPLSLSSDHLLPSSSRPSLLPNSSTTSASLSDSFPTPNSLSNTPSASLAISDRLQTQSHGSTIHSSPSDSNFPSTSATIHSLPSTGSPLDPIRFGLNQNFSNPYSKSGFDLMGALARVFYRPNPQINIGPVDTSTALVVVDARKNDLPIIFASSSFSTLTGYDSAEIIGQNCRFLQKPASSNSAQSQNQIQPAPQRSNLKRPGAGQIRSHILAGKEIQSSIVNYRKDGRPFVNLVTVVPITWDSNEIAFYVGFQVDVYSVTVSPSAPSSASVSYTGPLTSNSTSQSAKTADSLACTSDWLQHLNELPPNPPADHSPPSIQHALTPDVRACFGGEPQQNLACHYQTVLNESPDLILAISLKGTLFYVSASSQRILGYTDQELVNQNISKFCHAGDLTGILRQLKAIGNKPQTPIDLIFRAITQDGRSFWIECQGQLHVEVGKGRKYIVVSGREKQIGPLLWPAINARGGLGACEFWMKLSLDGLCLFATHPVREVLGVKPLAMVGKSLIQLAAPNERSQILNAIKAAYEGTHVVSLAHTLMDRDHKAVNVLSDFYPPHYSAGPLSCGQSPPPTRLTNPPRIIFCQTNQVSSARKRISRLSLSGLPRTYLAEPHELKNRAAGGADQNSLCPVPITRKPISPTTTTISPTTTTTQNTGQVESGNKGSSDQPVGGCKAHGEVNGNLFAALETTKETPWNFELSQLKRQNMALRSSLEIQGLGSRLKKYRVHSTQQEPQGGEPEGHVAQEATRKALSTVVGRRGRVKPYSYEYWDEKQARMERQGSEGGRGMGDGVASELVGKGQQVETFQSPMVYHHLNHSRNRMSKSPPVSVSVQVGGGAGGGGKEHHHLNNHHHQDLYIHHHHHHLNHNQVKRDGLY